EVPALAFGCDAPQDEGDGARRILASQAAARARRTNLRLWETIVDSAPLFPDCYLQWMAQLRRVEPSAHGPVVPAARPAGIPRQQSTKVIPPFAARCRIRMAATAD